MKNLSEDISLYLPKYLSSESSRLLLKELDDFPTDGTKDTIYTSMLSNHDTIFQGDGLANMKICDMDNERFKRVNVVVFSNTCDMDLGNKRPFSTSMCYAPIINLEKYEEFLKGKITEERLNEHINSIRKQQITSILYLPKGSSLKNDSLVFLDRINSIDNKSIDRVNIKASKLFTLSDYGLYFFILKLSIHFTRLQERIDRNKGEILESI